MTTQTLPAKWAPMPLFTATDGTAPDAAAPQLYLPEPDNPYLRRLTQFTRDRLLSTDYNLVSLFCGGGGLDLGLSFAGFGTVVASDVASVFVKTIESNIPHARGYPEDAMQLTAETLLERAGTDPIDLVAAGPPCQAFSILGRRGALDDPRGKLALKYFELVAAIKPRAFLFENVPGLLTLNGGADWQRVLQHARKATDYHIFSQKLNAVSFGIPQVRERVFMVGFREPARFEFPTKPTGPGGDDLAAAAPDGVPSRWALVGVDGLPNHDIRLHGPRVRARYMRVAPGDRDRTDHTDRIHPARPSGTVLVGSGAGGGRPHIHPFEPRVITVREAARLQSFPDWYVFHGGSTAQYRQIGNAVPPLLAYEVGQQIARALEGQAGQPA